MFGPGKELEGTFVFIKQAGLHSDRSLDPGPVLCLPRSHCRPPFIVRMEPRLLLGSSLLAGTNVLGDKDQGISGQAAKKTKRTPSRSSRISELTFKEKAKR